MRVADYTSVAVPDPSPLIKPPSSLISAKLTEIMDRSTRSRVYIASSEEVAQRIASATRCLGPSLDVIFLPAWDCLPYDRVSPSKEAMGRRMDALRVWSQKSERPKLMVTSLASLLQPVPPLQVIRDSQMALSVGDRFDADAFDLFTNITGYLEEAVADEPGELARRDGVIDIFPAGGIMPVRIVVSDDDIVEDLRAYDPHTQRTTETFDSMVFGPASEVILSDVVEETQPRRISIETRLLQVYESMPTLFDLLNDVEIHLETDWEERLDELLATIDDASEALALYDGKSREAIKPFYLDKTQVMVAVAACKRFAVDAGETGRALPRLEGNQRRKALVAFVQEELRRDRIVVIAGHGRAMNGLERAVASVADIRPVCGWKECTKAAPGSVLKLDCGLDRGFAIGAVSVVTAADAAENADDQADLSSFLAEPDIRLGDVVVHEDHGIGVLSAIDAVDVDGVSHDAARLDYRDGASVLVPMQEFGKLWRYGSSPETVTLDKLRTEAWSKRKREIEKDIARAARSLRRIARERQETQARQFIPPSRAYARFVRHFPYSETAHQTSAIRAVLDDLKSGQVMNRLICGDVGFGKTEVALRAAAAVALCGAQVAVIAPTTVLARQHYLTFERRFAGTGIQVAMLSRVLDRKAAMAVKAGLASGEIGIVVATQAVLSKDVAFSDLGLVVIDEEHRFGARDKQAMRSLSPGLHTLVMSATPIPRTLQSAMIGIQDVSILATSPARRRPVRTTLGSVDPASMRVALMREWRRGGQSFVVVPRIEDIAAVEPMLKDLVPELSVRVAHGKMKSADMDEVMVSFADGVGDILLSTNIIESGLDVPRANTIFIWNADRFGLAQLHQLRGRVGRGRTQGAAYLLVDGEVSEETRKRLSTMETYDRLGAGFALSLQDLDLRGAGDIAGEDQAGHMKLIGVSLYQTLLERAMRSGGRAEEQDRKDPAISIGVAGRIPEDYVGDATVRLNLYARLLRSDSQAVLADLEDEFEDRFGDMPEQVALLLRLARLRINARRLHICKLDAGPHGIAVTFAKNAKQASIKSLMRTGTGQLRDDRLVFDLASDDSGARLAFLEKLLATASKPRQRRPIKTAAPAG